MSGKIYELVPAASGSIRLQAQFYSPAPSGSISLASSRTVEYVDFFAHMPKSLSIFSPPFLKRQSFEHEKELRVLVWELPANEKEIDWTASPESLKLNVDPNELIAEVYISPNSEAWVTEHVEELLRRFDLAGTPVVRSNLLDERVV